MKLNFFAWSAALIPLLLLHACEKDSPSVRGAMPPARAVKQVDMTVFIPLHRSSLDYFDYCLRYTDNVGREYRDTIRNSNVAATSLDEVTCHTKTFSYRDLPVACTAMVELMPKVSGDTKATFSFIVPKPYIYPTILWSGSQSFSPTIEGLHINGSVIEIDSISIDEFLSFYGTRFSSHLRLNVDGSGCIDVERY